MSTTDPLVQSHYARDDILEKILGALRAAGKDPEHITREDLATVEEFHIRGREATRELAQLAGLTSGMSVLDVGCGIGGPARTFSAEFGAHVTGIDLVPQFVETATELTRRVRLSDRARFEQGDATKLPFPDRSFDRVILEHVNMNIQDKPALLAQAARVLRPDGRLALYEICAGANAPPHFPVPWASDPRISFLVTPDEFLAIAQTTGLRLVERRDLSQDSLRWLRAMVAAMSASSEGKPALSPSVVLGETASQKGANLLRNVEEDRVRVLMALLERDG